MDDPVWLCWPHVRRCERVDGWVIDEQRFVALLDQYRLKIQIQGDDREPPTFGLTEDELAGVERRIDRAVQVAGSTSIVEAAKCARDTRELATILTFLDALIERGSDGDRARVGLRFQPRTASVSVHHVRAV